MNDEKIGLETTNSYQTLLKVRVCEFTSCTAVLLNSHSEYSLKYKISVSNSPTGSPNTFAPLLLNGTDIELPLDHGLGTPFDMPLYLWYLFEVKSTVENHSAIANVWFNAR
jgi:hypothetical protein